MKKKTDRQAIGDMQALYIKLTRDIDALEGKFYLLNCEYRKTPSHGAGYRCSWGRNTTAPYIYYCRLKHCPLK